MSRSKFRESSENRVESDRFQQNNKTFEAGWDREKFVQSRVVTIDATMSVSCVESEAILCGTVTMEK